MKCFIGSSMGNGGFKRQRNDICISQRKSSSQMIVRSYGTFPWGQCLEHNRSDISAIDKKNKRCQLLCLSCPFDSRIEYKDKEKYIEFNQLKHEVAKIWRMKKVDVIPVVIVALGSTQVSLKMNRKARVRLRSRDDAETVFSWTGYNITKNEKKERKRKPLQLKSLVVMHCGFKMPRQQYQFWEEK